MLATRVLLSSGNWQPGLGPGLNFLANFSSSPQSFTIDVDPAFIELTRLKASLYRPSRDLAGETWDDGAPQANMTNIRDTWINQYVWEDVQSGLNDKYAHFTIMANARGNYTDSVPLHFVHQKSTRTDAIPLLMIHGWPSSFDEWRNVIGPLVNPPNSSLPAFNVVAPDIPGFGFSPAPDHDGLGSREVGQAFDDLMQRLGYSRYAIYTTDLGTFIGLWMLSDSSERVVSHLTDFYFVAPNATDMQRYETNQTTAEENAFIESDQSLKANNSGYLVVQSTRPLSVALAMTDSPVGFVGWMWQLMHTFSDGYPYTAEELITNAMLLYIQGTYGNIRAYKTFFSVCPPSRYERICLILA